jgi:alpha-tubulin suppressor-like RCC1 family protein
VFDSRIVSIECGGGIGAAITENGTLYTVGSVILNNTFFAELTQLPKDDCKVHSVSIGYDNICILTSTNIPNILTKEKLEKCLDVDSEEVGN